MALGFVISQVSYEQRIEMLNPFFFKCLHGSVFLYLFFIKNALCLPFMDMIQLPQGFRAVKQRRLLFTTMLPGVLGTQFFNLRSMKG